MGRTLERRGPFEQGEWAGTSCFLSGENSWGLLFGSFTEMLAEFCVILFTLAASTERLARQKHWRRCSSIPSIHRVERVLQDLTKEWSGTSSLPRFSFLFHSFPRENWCGGRFWPPSAEHLGKISLWRQDGTGTILGVHTDPTCHLGHPRCALGGCAGMMDMWFP